MIKRKTHSTICVWPIIWVTLFVFNTFLVKESKAQDRTISIRRFDMKDGLSQMKTTSIVMDSVGYIWVGTRSGLNRFDGENITCFYEEDGLLHNRIHDLWVNEEGELIILSYKGISFFNGDEFTHHAHDFLEAEYRMNMDEKGLIWIMRSNEVFTFDGQVFREVPININTNITWDWESNRVLFCNDSTVLGYKNGEFIPQEITPCKYPIPKENLLGAHEYIYRDHHAAQVLIRNNWVKINELLDLENSPVDNYIMGRGDTLFLNGSSHGKVYDHGLIRPVDYFIHPNGDFWLACENGFAQIIVSAFEHYTYQDIPYVWSVSQNEKGDILAGTYGHGMFIKEEGGQNFVSIDQWGEREMINPVIFHASSVKDGEGRPFFAGPRVFYWEDELKEFEKVMSFALDYNRKQNALIIGGVDGVTFIDLINGDRKLIDESHGLHSNDYIQCLAMDDDENVWAGSYNGLSRISANDEVKNYQKEGGTLPFKSVFTIYNDSQNHLWIGGDKGLALYRKDQDRIDFIELPLIGGNVKSLMEWDNHQLIIGAKNGVYFFDKRKYLSSKETDIHFFNSTNGYRGLEPGFTGFFRDQMGGVWIPSATSLDRMIPNRVRFKSTPIKARISELNNQKVGYKDDSVYELIKGVSDLQVQVDLIGTERPNVLGYSYRLDDDEWSSIRFSSVLTLNELAPGEHSLIVRPAPIFDGGMEKDEVAHQIRFKVNTPFYEHPNFPLLAGVMLLLLLIYSGYLFYRQRRENLKFSEQLNKSKYLESQLLLSELNPHFIFNVLSSIQRKVLLGDREEAAQYIVKLSKMIRNFLDASHRSHEDFHDFKKNNISLKKEIELITAFMEFEQMKSDDHFQFHVIVEEQINLEWTSIPPMIIQPFVENSIKHGLLLDQTGGNLWLSITKSNDHIVIKVEDDGIGRKAASEIRKNRQGHVSLGTMIIDQRIKLLNDIGHEIEVKTRDRIPKGTLVTITIKDF